MIEEGLKLTDKEMLELAAKAANINGMIGEVGHLHWIKLNQDGNIEGFWNPLTDDADALQLAVKLELVMDFRLKASWVCTQPNPDSSLGDWMGVSEKHHSDPYAATRRAIVIAAAEIGKDEMRLHDKFIAALNGEKGDFDDWLKDHNESECRLFIREAIKESQREGWIAAIDAVLNAGLAHDELTLRKFRRMAEELT